MSIIQAIKDFFDILLHSNSPEVQKRLSLRKIETELSQNPSGIYKGELVQPNFAEALRILFENTKPIAKILDNTVTSQDIRRNHRFQQELIVTGYNEEDRHILDSLSYEERKRVLLEAGEAGEHKTFELQRHNLEKIIANLNSPSFAKMDSVITNLKQLSDLCHFNYVSPLQLFDGNFAAHHTETDYVPEFMALPAATLENVFSDLYYLTADFSINLASGNAILALNQLLHGQENDMRAKKEIMQNLRRIQAVIKNTLNAKTLKNFICLAKRDPNFIPQKASYKENVCRNFAETLKKQFEADETHIRNEIKDNYVKLELSELFPEGKLESVYGYNAETSDIIGNNASSNFLWVVPLQILKTFLKIYYPLGVQNMMNDVVVEGMFTNAAKKTTFSQLVYSINDSANLIAGFESQFSGDGKYSIDLIRGYINDSHRDADFGRKLSSLIDNANREAKDLIQKISSLLYTLSEDLSDFLQDSKRSTSEIVSNLKGIMFSSRNREATSLLELQFPLWKNFFEIIKNYVIIKKAKKE